MRFFVSHPTRVYKPEPELELEPLKLIWYRLPAPATALAPGGRYVNKVNIWSENFSDKFQVFLIFCLNVVYVTVCFRLLLGAGVGAGTGETVFF